MTSQKTQFESMISTKDAELISCKYCDNETIVKEDWFVVSYTCPVCYSVPRLNKRKDD